MAIVTSRITTDSATSSGWTSLTISRASIANGLNGGTSDDDAREGAGPAAEQDEQRRQVAGHRDEAQRQRQRLEVVGPAHERADRGVDQREQREAEQEEHAVGGEQSDRQATGRQPDA